MVAHRFCDFNAFLTSHLKRSDLSRNMVKTKSELKGEVRSVTIYTTPTCIWCARTKEFFKQNNVSYKEMNVAGDTKAAREMIQKSGQMGVPVIDVGGEIVVGFDESKLRKLLGIK